MSKSKPRVRALVTGGAGFIGSHLCEGLLARCFRVTAVDDLRTSFRSNIDRLIRQKNHFTFYRASIFNEKLMQRLIKNCDIIYHLAAAVGVKLVIDHPVDSIITNVNGTEVVLKLASRYHKKVLLTSSSEIYGHMPPRPVKEDDRRRLGSTSVTRWSYAAAKSLDEFLAHAYALEKNLKFIIVRLFNTIGPRQNHQYGMVFPRFIRSALAGKPMTVFGTGEQQRTFTHVRDTVEILIRLSLTPKAYGRAYNVSRGGKPISIGALAKMIKKRLKSSSKIVCRPYSYFYGKQFEDVSIRIPDISRLKRTIRYKPRYSLEDMIDETARYLKQEIKKHK